MFIHQLTQYRDEYYNDNKPTVSDSHYDKLFDIKSTSGIVGF